MDMSHPPPPHRKPPSTWNFELKFCTLLHNDDSRTCAKFHDIWSSESTPIEICITRLTRAGNPPYAGSFDPKFWTLIHMNNSWSCV